jgi:hypothetical protein
VDRQRGGTGGVAFPAPFDRSEIGVGQWAGKRQRRDFEGLHPFLPGKLDAPARRVGQRGFLDIEGAVRLLFPVAVFAKGVLAVTGTGTNRFRCGNRVCQLGGDGAGLGVGGVERGWYSACA